MPSGRWGASCAGASSAPTNTVERTAALLMNFNTIVYENEDCVVGEIEAGLAFVRPVAFEILYDLSALIYDGRDEIDLAAGEPVHGEENDVVRRQLRRDATVGRLDIRRPLDRQI